jgi:predicted RNase H-like HicB family nuclease
MGARRGAQQYPEAIRPEGVISMRYAIVIEDAGANFSAYVPDLPGCVATGSTVEEAEREIRAGIEFHFEGLRADALPIPLLPVVWTTSKLLPNTSMQTEQNKLSRGLACNHQRSNDVEPRRSSVLFTVLARSWFSDSGWVLRSG